MFCQIGQSAVKGRKLHGHRNAHASFDLLDELVAALFHFCSGAVRIRLESINVQFDGRGPGLLHQLRVPNPAPGRSPIEAGNHRNRDALFGFVDQLQVQLRAQVVVVQVRKIVQRFRKAFRTAREVGMYGLAFEIDLLLK
jgi:hypothetical protein